MIYAVLIFLILGGIDFKMESTRCQDNHFSKNIKFAVGLILVIAATILTGGIFNAADAFSGWTSTFNSQYGTSGTSGGTTLGSCVTCHVQLNGRGGYNDYGLDSKAAGIDSDTVGALIAIEMTDSDGDGFDNLEEINAGTFPGDAGSKPTAASSPPVADAGLDQTVQEGALVTLNGANSSDPDDDIVSYEWDQTAGNAVNLSNASAAQPTFTATAGGGSATFQLTVTDSENNQDTDICVVDIVAVDYPPTAHAGPDQTVDEETPVTLNASGSTDPNGDIVSVLWEQTGGTSVTLSNTAAMQPTFTAPDVDPAGEALTFRVTVTDSTSRQDTDSCTVNVAWINLAPTADAGGDQTADEGTVVQLDSLASSDPDDGIVSYQWIQTVGIPVTISNTAALQPTFTAPNVGPGGESLTFQLTVTDNGGLKDIDTCVVNVSWVNVSPIANAGPDQNVQVGVDVTLDGSNSSDADDGVATYQWTQTGGPMLNLSDDTAQKPTFIAPDVGSGGAACTFSLTVTDQFGLQDTDTCVVNVITDNFPPTADAGADQTADEADPVTLDGSNSSDPDGNNDIVAYLWTQTDGPVVTLSDAAAVQPLFTAPDVGPGGVSLTFQLAVFDSGGLQHTDTIIVNVSWVNLPPTADAGTDQTVSEAQMVTLDGLNSSDSDDGIASYQWSQITGTSVTLSNPATVKPTFTAPAVGAGGSSLTFQLTVTDENGLQSSDTCIVNISWNNLAPTADAGSDQTVDPADSVTLDGSMSEDPEGEIDAYLWKQMAGPAVTLSDPAAVQPTFTAPAVGLGGGSLTFQLTVTDSGGLEATDTCNVNVTWQNQTPTADAGLDQTVSEGTTVTLDGSASSDPDDGIVSYLWTQTGNGPSATLSDPTSEVVTFVAPPVDSSGAELIFELTVTDAGGLQSSHTVTVQVNDNGITGFSDEALTLMAANGTPMGVIIENGCSITKLNTIDPTDLPSSSDMPEDLSYGLFDIQAKPQSPGEKVIITIYLPEPAPADYNWYKFDQRTNKWVNYSAKVNTAGDRGAIFNEARDQVTLTLIDGGMGDDDGLANGIIQDPSGLGLVPPFSIGSNDFGAGSSCLIGTCTDKSLINLRKFPATKAFGAALTVLFSFLATAWCARRKRGALKN